MHRQWWVMGWSLGRSSGYLSGCLSIRQAVLAAFLCGSALAYGHSADEMVDPKSSTRTLMPRVVVDSGRLDWVPYPMDLSPWPTLCDADPRPMPRPQQAQYVAPLRGDAVRGRGIAMNTRRGNCVTCHEIPGEEWPGTFGAPLNHYKQRRMSDADLYQQIYDVRITAPRAVMPPFGALGVLSDQDIRDVVAYLQSLE